MEYLVLMKLRDDGVGESEKENQEIVGGKIVPGIKMLIDMEKEGMLSGGFFGGQRSAAFIMSVEDEETLDNTIASLPFADIFDVEMVQLETLKEALERDEKMISSAPPKAKKAGRGCKPRAKGAK